MRRRSVKNSIVMWMLICSAFWWTGTPLPAAEVRDGIPNSASVVIRWKSPKAMLARAAEYADAVQPGAGEIVNGALRELGQVVGSPGLKGVDTEKDWWLVVFAESGEIPSSVFIIPVTNADAVEQALPDPVFFAAVDKLALLSENEEAIGWIRSRMEGKGKSLWSEMDAASKKLFDAADLSVLVNINGLADGFRAELNLAEPQLNNFIDQITMNIPVDQRAQIVPALDMYRVLGKALLQGIRDSNSLTMGITITKDAIQYEDRLQVKADSPTAMYLGAQTGGNSSLLSKLPVDKLAYVGIKANLGSMIDWSMNMTKTMLGDLSEDKKKAFDAAITQMKTLKYGEMVFYMDLDTKAAGAIRGGSVAEVTPTSGMRDISRSMVKAIGEVQSIGFKQTMSLEPGVEKIGGLEVDRITTKQELADDADPFGLQKKIRDLLFGEKGIQQLVMYQPKYVLQTFGGELAELQTLAESLNSQAAANSAVTAARKRLFENANVIVLADVARTIVGGLKIAAREATLPIDSDALDAIKVAPSYVGYALTCEATAVRSQFEIPVVQSQAIAKVVQLLLTP